MKVIKNKYPKVKFDRSDYPDMIAYCNGKQVGYWDAEQKEGLLNERNKQ
jgi:hypothetical protein